MKVVEFYYSEMSDDYGFNDMYEFKKIVQKLYDSYSSMYSASETSPVQNSQARTARTSRCYVNLNEEPRRKRLSLFLRGNKTSHELSDLDQYCNEPLLSWKEGEYFDILSWWKTHGVKYPILARMARDVLAIPTTTVASESAFSLGGRIIHKYRSRLDPQVVEALVCTKDWISASRQDCSGISSILDDFAGLSMNDNAEHDDVAPADDGDNIMDLEDEEN
ncbi:zinc finger BED domain-containing protein DAYSLEEPER-like [Panicum miliaceum]|uniref:Zinc finger BED domain-containing protein DAYSLEEPER-like n=1 Tax=Panicum miliaceum TaxID=4540 RepID=A0A3L6PD28_PANMI|nr:zinc finger BED domain-containing protein DAYSLEEPER-like [Panicum miliaceum]